MFQCDEDIRIGTIGGPVCERLGCDESELLAHGWHPFLHRGDWDTVAQMGRALAATQAGRYQIRAVAKSGQKFLLAIRTHILFSAWAPSMGGVIELLSAESVIRYFDLGA